MKQTTVKGIAKQVSHVEQEKSQLWYQRYVITN